MLTVRTCFFACFNYLTFHIYNQSCIVFIYILYIILQIKEKEPLPQLVEVLSHAAARAATFFNCTAAWAVYSVGLLLFVTLTFQSYAVIQTATRPAVKSAIPAVSILCSHVDCFLVLQIFLDRNKAVSILRSHVDCFGNSLQRLHFLHNVALCILLSFGAVIMVRC